MLKEFLYNTITRLKIKKRRGQVAVFYALLVPLFLFCCGVGLDLGWYYLNVSRLQNAADAAVIVGAKELIKSDEETFKDYYIKLVYQYPANKPEKTVDTTEGDKAAANYTLKNLSSDENWVKTFAPAELGHAPQIFFAVAEAEGEEASSEPSSEIKKAVYTMKDNYSRGGNPTITMTPSLYTKMAIIISTSSPFKKTFIISLSPSLRI